MPVCCEVVHGSNGVVQTNLVYQNYNKQSTSDLAEVCVQLETWSIPLIAFRSICSIV